MNDNVSKGSFRDGFQSRFGILMALSGSAIGLGNLWRFPYLVGENGGAAFIIIYLIMVFTISLPIMYAEFIIGKRGGKNPIGSFKVLASGSGKYKFIGIIEYVAALSIISFYCVVGGWSVKYMTKAFLFEFTKYDMIGNLGAIFTEFTTSPIEPIFYTMIFLILTAMIVMAGIKNGIEKSSKVIMPLLFVIVIIIAIRSITLDGAKEGIVYLFNPDFSKVTGRTFINALGQSFFSLSVGIGVILTYASYAGKDEQIMKCSALTAIADTSFAIIASCAVMPAVFAFGISPQEGPGLVYIILPGIFAQLPFGGIIAILFFVALTLAAITSAMSLFEVLVTTTIEEVKLSRKKAIIILLPIVLVLAALCSLSQGVLSGITIFGLNIFNFFDKVSANILLPIGGLLMVLFVGWRLKKTDVYDELTNRGTLTIHSWLLKYSYFAIRFVIPIAIAVILIAGFVV